MPKPVDSTTSFASTAASSTTLASGTSASTVPSLYIKKQPSRAGSKFNFDAIFEDPPSKAPASIPSPRKSKHEHSINQDKYKINRVKASSAVPSSYGFKAANEKGPSTEGRRHSADTFKSDPVSFSSSNKTKSIDHSSRTHRSAPPPERDVQQSHHHHHVIPVDSETDFSKMHFDEAKVNYLPYNPPVAVSQTGLIQSIGRPFNSNHAKYLPDPGDEFKLSRRVSQVKLKQISILGNVNSKIVDGLAATIKLLSILIGISGAVFFVFILVVAGLSTPMEYAIYFLDNYPVCKSLHIVGVVQPIAVGSYCRYALINLKHMRGYFLRVPIALSIPVGVVLCGSIQLSGTVTRHGEMENVLYERMEHYFQDTYISRYSHDTWDGIQTWFKCCGYENSKDWEAYNKTSYPFSCCSDNLDSNITCTANSTGLKQIGCKSAYKGSNISIALFFIWLGISIIIVEILSIFFMRSIYAVIGKELYDERHNMTIMWGKICSLCDVEDTDEELEYDEIVDHTHHSDEDAKKHGAGDKNDTASAKPSAASTATTATVNKSLTSTTATVASSNLSVAAPQGAGRGRGMGIGRGITNKVAPAFP